MSREVFAAVDCGTNSTRLLVESASGEVVAREMRITRLGQGVDASGALHPDAVQRTLDVLRAYRAIMDTFGVSRGRLAATSAARDASNGPNFLRQASEVTGLEAEILSGQEEGECSFAGAMVGLDPAQGDDLVLDIGGGSTEIVLQRDGRISAYSMQIGCVRVTERTLLSDPPAPGELAVARAMIANALDGAVVAVPELDSLRPNSRLVGLAGTVATLAMIDQGLERYDRDRVHHYWLSQERVAHWCEVLASMPRSERSKLPGMVEGREDVIAGGVLVLDACLDRLNLEGCMTSESDILDGLVASLRS